MFYLNRKYQTDLNQKGIIQRRRLGESGDKDTIGDGRVEQ